MDHHIQLQIRSKIDSFARELESLVRQAAVAAVGDALGQSPGAARRGPKAKPVARRAAAPKAAGRPAKRGGRRTRLSPKASGAVADQILAHIKSHPGQRSEEVRATLRVAKNIWQPAIRRLIEERKIIKKGEKRGTAFTAR